jgi:hypothetical protein
MEAPTNQPDDDMPSEIDFSDGVRGKFIKPDASDMPHASTRRRGQPPAAMRDEELPEVPQ